MLIKIFKVDLSTENSEITCETMLLIIHYTLRSHNLLFLIFLFCFVEISATVKLLVSFQLYKFPEISYTCP